MPRTVQKSRAKRCNRSDRRKRQHLKHDVDLSTVREAVRSSTTANPHRLFTNRTHQRSSYAPYNELKSRQKPKCVPDSPTSTDKPKSIIEHGIRFMMVPLHLLNLVWGSSQSPSPEVKIPARKISADETPNKPDKQKKISSSTARTPSSSELPLSKPHLPDPQISCTPFAQLPVTPPSLLSSKKKENGRTIRPNCSDSPSFDRFDETTQTCPIRKATDETSDESSDEMVTATECIDDSSDDQWSSANSSSFLNMSIDLEYPALEKKYSSCDRLREEPMDVSMEGTNIEAKLTRAETPTKKPNGESAKRLFSSSSSAENNQFSDNFSNLQSIDREIANIFQRACTSSSSSDGEDYLRPRRRKNDDPITNRTTNAGTSKYRSHGREEICDATIRAKRTSCYAQHPQMNLQARRNHREESNLERAILLLNVRVDDPDRRNMPDVQQDQQISNQTDSAYSDEDVEMNTIIHEALNRLESVPMSLQESIIEWMDQDHGHDYDYAADTEDTNDGLPSPLRYKISKKVDLGFVGRENRERALYNAETPELRPFGFLKNSKSESGGSCHCGNPECSFISVAMRSDEPAIFGNGNYPRAPTPLRHLYYEYPEFMIPPTDIPKIDKSSPWVLIPCSTNLA